jgi:hypothetical protein
MTINDFVFVLVTNDAKVPATNDICAPSLTSPPYLPLGVEARQLADEKRVSTQELLPLL